VWLLGSINWPSAQVQEVYDRFPNRINKLRDIGCKADEYPASNSNQPGTPFDHGVDQRAQWADDLIWTHAIFRGNSIIQLVRVKYKIYQYGVQQHSAKRYQNYQ
jgi:hypothetical protein